MPRRSLIQLRRGTSAEWTSANPTLADGEIGFDKTANELKIGNGSTAWSSLSALTGGGGSSIPEYYSFYAIPESDTVQEDGNYVGLSMASVPTNFLTSNHDWWVALRISRVGSRDDQGWTICDGGALNAGIAWRPRGDYFMTNSTSSYLHTCDIATPVSSNMWIIVQWDDSTSRLDAWVDTGRELNQESASITSTTPSQVSWLRTVYSSNYWYNFRGGISAIVMGNGYKLTNAEAITMTGNQISYADLDAAVQAKVTHAWSFNATSVVTDLGGIALTPEVAGGSSTYEFVKDTYEAPLATIADSSLTLDNDQNQNVDLSALVTNRGGLTLTYSKVSGETWMGSPNSSTGIANIDADTVTPGSYSGVYRITDGDGNTDDMTLSVTVEQAPVEFFGEDWESGLNGWTAVTDPSAGTTADQDLVLSGMTNSSYDQTYTKTSLDGVWQSSNDQFSTSFSGYNSYSYDAGGGTWYLAVNDINTGNWVVISTDQDPSSITNGQVLNGSGSETIVGFSETRDGASSPWGSDSKVSYSGGTFSPINNWAVGTAVNNGGTQSSYITNDGGTSNAYTTNDSAVTHIYKEFTTPSDISGGVTMNFDWKCFGESSYDYLRVFVAPAATVPTGGAEVSSLYNIAGGTGRYNQSSTWQSESVDISSLASSASTTYTLILQWKNDSSGGSQPPAAVDNISIKA